MRISARAEFSELAEAIASVGGSISFTEGKPAGNALLDIRDVEIDGDKACEKLLDEGYSFAVDDDELPREPLDRAKLQDFVFAVSGGDLHMASALAATLFDENETLAVDQALRLCRRAA